MIDYVCIIQILCLFVNMDMFDCQCKVVESSLCKVKMSPLKGHNMDQLLTMSNREITRLDVMQRLKDKRLRQHEASRMLGISVRQVKR